MDKMIDLIEKCFAVGWTIFFGGFFVFVTVGMCTSVLDDRWCFLVWIAKMYFIIFHQEKYTEIKESCTLY